MRFFRTADGLGAGASPPSARRASPGPLADGAGKLWDEADAIEGQRSSGRDQDRAESSWGQLPVFVVLSALALVIVAVGDALSRSGRGGGQALFWLGVLSLVALAAFRLSSPVPARRERVGIVVVAGMALYLVKVFQNPFVFLYSDEFSFAYNAERVLQTHSLFSENPILTVSAHYPGLATTTSAVASLTGLNVFGAGVFVVGAARLLVMIALYLFFEQVSGSSRIAGLSGLFYAAHPNFLFYSAEYGYESLALPLAALVIVAVTRWMHSEDDHTRRGWAIAALIGTIGVVMTHHMTAYALLAFLIAASAVHALMRRRGGPNDLELTGAWSRHGPKVVPAHRRRLTGGRRASPKARERARRAGITLGPDETWVQPHTRGLLGNGDLTFRPANPWFFALFAAGATIAWLIFVASDTVGYLSFIFTRALEAAIQTALNETAPRQLFGSDKPGAPGRSGEQLVAVASVVLIALSLPVALRQIWKRYRRPLPLVLAAAASAYLFMLFLRLVPQAWEIGTRTSEFLFVGVAFALAVASVRVAEAFRPLVARAVLVGALVLIFAGGVIAAWPRDLRLGLPYRITSEGRVLEPQGSAAARWSRAYLGTRRRILADQSNARLLLAQGQVPITGGRPNKEDVILYNVLAPWMVELLRNGRARYVLIDRRRIRQDRLAAYFFTSARAARAGLFPRAWYEKFDRQPGASKVFDSGDIAIYDLQGFRYDPNLQ